jgi:pSer/pThr/pTyr-binding forkhead associated (FHA) protein
VVSAYLEVWRSEGPERVFLDGGRVSVGKDPANDVVIRDDRKISRVHLVLEAVGPGWTITDVGSRNGTYLNGERLLGSQLLRRSDEILAGSTRIVFGTAGASAQVSETVAGKAPPKLTPRETDVLVALSRPVLEQSMLTEPSSVSAIAAELVVSDSAVKKVLTRLYDKFDLHDAERRRGRLVAEALARGAVGRAMLRDG